MAAQEVAYVVKSLGTSLLGIEIGNEPDNYHGTYYNGVTGWTSNDVTTETTFENLWEKYRAAIVALTPSAPITGPATADINRMASWTNKFDADVTSSQITQLTQHYYRGQAGTSGATAANLITPDTALVGSLTSLASDAKTIGVPYRISECNNYANGGQLGVSNSYASTLWVLDFLNDCAQGGSVGVNLHGGGDAAAGYTPIADNNGMVNGVRPEFYGILLFVLAGQGTLYKTTVTAGSLNVTAYAVYTASGGLNLIINNKDSTNNLQVSVQLPKTYVLGTLLELTQYTTGAPGPDISATTSVTIQGATVGTNGSFTPSTPYYIASSGNQITCYVPALSAVLLQLS